MEPVTLIAVATVVLVLALVFLSILRKPIKLVFKLMLNTIGGFIALLLINFAGSFIGISIGVNWINAVVLGIFGMPGAALLLILQWLLLI